MKICWILSGSFVMVSAIMSSTRDFWGDRFPEDTRWSFLSTGFGVTMPEQQRLPLTIVHLWL